MAHGGKREGAGRKQGALTRRTRETAERAAKEGKVPLDVMLENMRHFQKVAHDAERAIEHMADEVIGSEMPPEEQFKMLLGKVKAAANLRLMGQECARDAAGFMHPKLTAVTHTGKKGGPIVFKTIYE